MTKTSSSSLRSGANQADIDAALAAAEEKRRLALAATINAMVACGFAVSDFNPFSGSIVTTRLLLGIFVVGTIWRISNGLWRHAALSVLAPRVTKNWGQSRFLAGLAAFDFDEWMHEGKLPKGFRFPAWRSEGRYRDVNYEMREITIRRRRHSQHRSGRTFHRLVIRISVPTSFNGVVEILPAAGFLGSIDEAIRRVTSDDLQRIRINPDFDRHFDTLASSDASVNELLSPGFQKVMVALAMQHPQSIGRFENGWFSLQLPVKQVALVSARLMRPMPELAAEADPLWWELTTPHRLIDALMGDHIDTLS